MDAQQFLKLSGAVTGPMLVRQALRETLKFIPGVGSTANAAMAFATTYALGKANCWYFGEILAGHLRIGLDLFRQAIDRLNGFAERASHVRKQLGDPVDFGVRHPEHTAHVADRGLRP